MCHGGELRAWTMIPSGPRQVNVLLPVVCGVCLCGEVCGCEVSCNWLALPSAFTAAHVISVLACLCVITRNVDET